MDIVRHLQFCPSGTPFFDQPHSGPDATAFPLVAEELPEGWTRGDNSEWVMLTPPDSPPLREQGWKIHASATPENAAEILDVVRDHCLASGVRFKFIRSTAVLTRRNSKYGDRSASGKFVTIYPDDDAAFARILDKLGELLDGQEGPYILSDLRWRRGPLYVRYGGFVTRTTRAANGELVYCITDPDGTPVPDQRGPGFRPPAWAELPDCLAEAIAARNAGTMRDFPYRVTSALHFSNGGGVYRGTDTRTDTPVLLREARPLAGLDNDGRDALTRLEREHWALQTLAGAPCIPTLIDYRRGHEHYFLVREFVEGRPLNAETNRRNPLATGDRDPEAFARYAEWATGILRQIEAGVRGMHERGVVFGDLHPANILVRDDGSVVFIDFETATAVADDARQTMGALGFMAPEGCTGAAADLHALACVRLALFAPMAPAATWGPDKVDQLVDFVTRHFPVGAEFAAAVRDDIEHEPGATRSSETLWEAPDPGTWPALRGILGEAILATATPERTDRLFPGDAEQFFQESGGLTLGTGAAGVLWALAEAGLDVPTGHVDWLVSRARDLDDPAPGLYRGLSGVAFALQRLGRADEALEVMDRVAAAPPGDQGPDLLAGLAGIGLTHLHFAALTGDADRFDAALDAADRLVAGTGAAPGGTRLGLMRGEAGTALLLLRLYEHDGGQGLLDLAEQALRRDLAGLGWTAEDGLPESAIGHFPVIGTGCAGTGMVLHDLLAHRPDPELAGARDAIREVAERPFLHHVGMFHGRAGTLAALRHLDDGSAQVRHAVRRHVENFGLHAVPLHGRPAFLGHESLRLSTDLGTGAAGVLLALEGAMTGRHVLLPFLSGSTARDAHRAAERVPALV